MGRKQLIRKERKRLGARTVRAAEFAFACVLLLAVAVGGATAARGFPALLDSMLPDNFMAAQASSSAPSGFVALRLFGIVARQGRFAPQVLFPVASHGFPAWLEARREIAAYREHGVTVIAPRHDIAIAICIDDMGNDAVQDRRAIALPRPVALSFLPYPEATPVLVREAERAGHAVLLHMPMEALGNADPGPMALRTDLPPDEIVRRLDWALARVPGLAGVNNHEGSRFTADETGLVPVAEALADRHVFFFDSKTTPDSKVVEVAHAFGVASASRDVFLDDDQSAAAIEAQLAELEGIARREGVAIAIGHPHPTTMDVLARWTKDAGSRGLTLVPLATAIRMKTERAISLASAAQD